MPTIERMTWLPAVLRDAGLTVITVLGWETRGHDNDGDFTPRAVMVHHDASAIGDSPGALTWLVNGFKSSGDSNYDAQCWVDRLGHWYVIAAGRAQHAGAGTGWGRVPAESGNRLCLGVETDHTTNEPWPPAQARALVTGVAAACAFMRMDPRLDVLGHKEYAPGRKTDPAGLNMDTFRAEVARTIAEGPDMALDDADKAWIKATIRHDMPAGVPTLLQKIDAVARQVGALDLVDEGKLAAELAPLLTSQLQHLTSADLTAVATAVADEQARRQAS